MGSDVVYMRLASDVANAGTFTVAYPTNKDSGAYAEFAEDHYIISNAHGKMGVRNGLATFSFGASSITVTNSSGGTLAANTDIYVNLAQPGDLDHTLAKPEKMAEAVMTWVYLGAPDTIDDDGICAAQNRTGAGALLVNGALATGGVATLDVPRNVIVDSGGADTAVITVTGTDTYGAVLIEAITLNGTTGVAGKKAFKTITAVSASATVSNSMFMGPGDVLGIPVHIPELACLIKEAEDGAAPTAGTLVAAVNTLATATTGDVRGTYDPNSAANGAKSFALLFALPNPSYKGVAQYDG